MPDNQKTSLKVTQVVQNQTALDWSQNMANHYAGIKAGIDNGSDLIVFPELSITGYEVNDDFQRTDNDRIYESLSNAGTFAKSYAEKSGKPAPIISVGHPWRLQLREAFEGAAADPDLIKNPLYDRLNLPFNVQTLIADGRVIGMTAKANLFRDERGYENRYFNEWSFGAANEMSKMMGIESQYGTIPIALPDGKEVPFGRPLIYVTDKNGHGYVHAAAICEEKWVATQYDGAPHDSSRYAQFNVIPSIARYLGTKEGLLLEIANASPPSRLKQDKHMALNELASQHVNVVIDTDSLGTSGSTFAQFGHALIAQDGQTISAGKRMAFGQIETTTSIVNVATANPDLERLTHTTLVHDFQNPSAAPKADLVWNVKGANQEWDNPNNPDRWKEELIRNQALWMFDYMRKSKSQGIAEALSGGKDSSFNCAMVRVMVELAVHDLGIDGFCEQMSHLHYKDDILKAYRKNGTDSAVKVCMDNMLTAIYMGTDNSSYETWYAAQSLIKGGEFVDKTGRFSGIGGKFRERNIQDLVTHCALTYGTKNVSDIPADRKAKLFEELSNFVHASPYKNTPDEMDAWAEKLLKEYPEVDELTSAALPGQGIAYENFQARIRGVLIMALANVENKMAVANPNLDEAYGAYATFCGDLHSGTVNWNAGIHKADQAALMDYLEEKGIHGVMDRITSLAAANNNKPTAELQPKKDGEVVQNDEDALQGTFEQKAALARLRHHTKIHTDNGDRWMNAGELFDAARQDDLFAGLDDNKLFNAVTYFYQRWEGPAQHKIHATPIAPTHGESVDKQTSLRTPNLSGQSRDEIVQLGVDLLFDWAKEDGLNWDEDTYTVLRTRAWQDKKFVAEFYSAIWNRDESLENQSYNLRGLYQKLKNGGFDTVFTPLAANHPIRSVYNQLPEFN